MVLKNNKTWQILDKAEKEGYAVACVNCYNMEGVFGTIRAAERQNSPAMIEIFPWSIHQFGEVFVKFCADACRSASVPVALHLDHAMEEDVIKRAIDMGWFDSIMVDMSRHSEEENIRKTRELCAIARAKGIATEAELGRIDGGEDGVMPAEAMEALMTRPEDAVDYVQQTGVDLLAPSFGNIHGDYVGVEPKDLLKLDILKSLYGALKESSTPIVLHGTNDFDEQLMRQCVELGVRKVNVNKIVAQDYYQFTEQSYGNLELTKVIEGGIDRFQKGVEDVMVWLGSSGKA